MTNALARTSGGGWLVAPQNMSEVYAFAKTIAESTFCPKDMRGKAGDVIAAIQLGSELGMSPMAALQGICVINGRPSLYGDALLALVLAQPDVIDVVEEYDDKTKTASCTVIRQRGQRERSTTRTFSMDDAVKAKLANKAGPWSDYPKRMQAMRARSWALRDACPDILRGMIAREEAQDIPAVQAVVSAPPRAALPAHAAEGLTDEEASDRNAQREESSSGQLAAAPAVYKVRPVPERTAKNYADKAVADKPFTELSDGELTNYIAYYEEKLKATDLQPNHREAVRATVLGAERELDRRLEEEGQPLAADSTPEAEDVPETRVGHADTAAPDYDPETGEVLDHPPEDDDLSEKLEKSIELAKAGNLYGDTSASWGLTGADAPEHQTNAKRTRKGAA